MLDAERIRLVTEGLTDLPELLDETLDVLDPVASIVERYASSSSVLFLARHACVPIALEGALKLKELAYLHAEGFPAGELKHGPIALVAEGLPILTVLPSPSAEPELHGKVVSNMEEVRARGAHVIAIAESGDKVADVRAEAVIHIPVAPVFLRPILAVVPLQIFARDMATSLGYDVDQPRNLAKSVTVE